MSYNTDLQNNNTSLQEILATVNSLPEAGGSSGGGAEIETCTVGIQTVAEGTIYYLALENGNIVIKNINASYVEGLENVIVNSFLIICAKNHSELMISPTPLYSYELNNYIYTLVFQIPSGGTTIRALI